MKSNGRRRWRKWARKVRDEDARRSWPPGFIWSFANAGYLRRHNANGYAVPRSLVAVEIPAKPFAAMSLVGMTMGARKRWARNDTPLKPEYQGTKESSAKHRSNRYLWSVMHRQGTGQILYAAARAKAWLGARPVKEGPLLRRWVNPPPDAAQGVREGGYRQVHGALSPHFRQPSQAKGR